MNWIIETIKALRDRAWYGKLTLHFEAGRVTMMRKEETLKPPKQ